MIDLNYIYDNWEQIVIDSKDELDKAIEYTKSLVEASETDEDKLAATKLSGNVNKRIEQVDRVQLKVKANIKELALLMHHYKGE